MSRIASTTVEILARDKTGSIFSRLQASMRKIQSTAERASRAARNVLLVGGGGIAGGLKAYMDFEKQMAMVSTMLGPDSMKWMPAYTEGIQNLSEAFGEGTDSLSKGLYDLLSASVPPEQALAALTIATEAAKGGFTTTATAVDGITSMLNAYKLSADEASRVSDMMFMAVKKGKINFEQLAAGVGKVAPMAKAAGMSLEELFGSIATMTRQGVSPEETMTGIRQALAYAAKNGKTFAEVMKELAGMNLKELIDVGIPQEAAKGVSALAGSYDELKQDIADMANSSGQRLAAFGKYQTTLAYQWDQMKQSAAGLARELGSAFVPLARELFEWLKTGVARSKEWLQENRHLVPVIAKVGFVLGAVLIVLPKILTLVISLTAALALLATPVGAVVAGLGLLGAAFTLALGDGEKFTDKMKSGFQKIVTILDVMFGSFEGLKLGIGTLGEQAGLLFAEGLLWLAGWMAKFWHQMVGGFKIIWEEAINAVVKGWVSLLGKVEAFWEYVKVAGVASVKVVLDNMEKLDLYLRRKAHLIPESWYQQEMKAIDDRRKAETAAEKEKLNAKLKAIDEATAKELEGLDKVKKANEKAIVEEGDRKMAESAAYWRNALKMVEGIRKMTLANALSKMEGMPKLSDRVKGLLGIKDQEPPKDEEKPQEGGQKPAGGPAGEGGGPKLGPAYSARFTGLQELYSEQASAAAKLGEDEDKKQTKAIERAADAGEDTVDEVAMTNEKLDTLIGAVQNINLVGRFA